MAVSKSIFPAGWLENETLHCICARYVLLNGRHTLKETVKALFTTKLGKIACHFQGHLDSFVAQTKGALGSVDEIICKHTVLSNYVPFMSEISANNLVQAMRAPGPYQTANTFLKEISHPYPKQRHLRMCADCAAEDEAIRGFAHWRRDHQLPGTYRCLKHGTALRQLWVKNALHGTVVQMPQSDRLYLERLTVPVPEQDGEQEASLLAIARVALAISTLPRSTRFTPQGLYRVYRARLDQLGLMVGNRVRRPAADLDLLRFAGALDGLADAPQWLTWSVHKDGLITRMASPSPPFARPVLHTVFIAWLFESAAEFLAMYAAQAAADPPPARQTEELLFKKQPAAKRVPGSRTLERAARKAEFLAQMQLGMTAFAACRHTGTNISTGYSWAAAAGLGRNRGEPSNAGRPEARVSSKRLLKAGGNTEAAVPGPAGSSDAAHPFIDPERAAHEAAKEARRQARISIWLPRARASWIEALKRSRRGDMGATRLVVTDGTYFKKYDRVGYDAVQAAHPQTPQPIRKLHNLNEIDVQLSIAIAEAAVLLRSESPTKLIHTWDIVRVLEERGLMNMECERLLMPLAKAALRQAVRRPSIAGDEGDT